MGRRPVDVVRATGINEGYLSELIAGNKTNPSAEVLLEIADFLGIPMQYFYRPPPTREQLDQTAGIDPVVLAKLKSSNH